MQMEVQQCASLDDQRVNVRILVVDMNMSRTAVDGCALQLQKTAKMTDAWTVLPQLQKQLPPTLPLILPILMVPPMSMPMPMTPMS
eukprot:ANDGO_06154.mRNA.1 hypothetical protein